MSKKVKGSISSPPLAIEDGSPPTAVDFIFRTMSARAGIPGKRQIRPKNVEELMEADIQELGSDEDPDFDVSKDKHHNESDVSIESDEDPSGSGEEGDGEGDKDSEDKMSMDGNVEDTDDEDDLSYNGKDLQASDEDTSDEEGRESDTSSEDDTDSQTPVQKRSALRDTLQKLNDSELSMQFKRKRKHPKKASSTTKTKVGAKKEDNTSDTQTTKKKAGKGMKKDTKGKKADKSKGGGRKKVDDKGKAKERRKRKTNASEEPTISELVSNVDKSQKENRDKMIIGNPICSACLGKTSDALNEIVECDSCGITVHEACYGVSDTLSVSSGTGSSCSTEPWFCDACRTGVKQISCELCPVPGGLFKETTAGRWVHLVCALYTPGVVITDNGLPSLYEIPYSKWGAHPCSFCEDSYFSRAGVCIPCDAGMCKTYLHATCAQKHGLLSDPVIPTATGLELAADPYYAACKLHTTRDTSKRRSKCFATLQEQLRIKQQQKICTSLAGTEEEKQSQMRIKRKLERIRFKVAIKQAINTTPAQVENIGAVPLTAHSLNTLGNTSSPFPVSISGLPPSWKAGNKKVRLLPTSAGGAIAFYRKATLMGLDTQSLELEDLHTRLVSSVNKKYNIQPALGVEYAAYYTDRESRITKLTDQCDSATKINKELYSQQTEIQKTYERHAVHNLLMEEDNDLLRNKVAGFITSLKVLYTPANKKLSASLQTMEREVEVHKTTPRRNPGYSRSPSRASPGKSVGIGQKKSRKSSPTRPLGERLSMKLCSVCKKTDDQPWIIACDRCKKFYHLTCLDPPLTKLPKRSKLCGWMCSDCGDEEYEAEEAEVDTEAPRTLRGRTKIRKPGKYRNSTDSRDDDGKIINTNRKSDTAPGLPTIVGGESPPDPTLVINGSAKSPKKRKRRTSKMNATPGSSSLLAMSSPPILMSDEASNKKPRKIKTPRKSKENLVNLPIPAILDSVVSSGDLPTDSIGKKTTKKPRSMNRKSKLSDIPSNETSILNTGPLSDGQSLAVEQPKIKKERKSRSPSPKKQKEPKTQKSQKARGATKPKNTEQTTNVDQGDGQVSTAASPVPKKKKARSQTKEAEAGHDPADFFGSLLHSGDGNSDLLQQDHVENSGGNESSEAPPSDKKKKVSQASRQQKLEQRRNIMQSMAAAAAAAGKGKTNDNSNSSPATIQNGKPKGTKQRRSSTILDHSVPPRPYEKSVPPKKRKRVSSSATAVLQNQNDVINAVASGSVEGGTLPAGNLQNGISHSPAVDGVLMQGVAPSKSVWPSTASTSDNEHSIMKGYAMGANCSNQEIVTANFNDIIDSFTTSTTSSTVTTNSYSPGFYSNTTLTLQNSTSGDTGSSTLPNSLETEQKKPAQKWGQSQPSTQESQNVLKLTYDMNSTPVSVTSIGPASLSKSMALNISPPSGIQPVMLPAVLPPSLPLTTNPSSSPQIATAPNSQDGGSCYSCTKPDLKKNMVTCDKCAQDFHFMCLTPPLKYSPRRRNYAWYCSTCDDSDGQPQKNSESSQIPRPTPPQQPKVKTVHLYGNEFMKNPLAKKC